MPKRKPEFTVEVVEVRDGFVAELRFRRSGQAVLLSSSFPPAPTTSVLFALAKASVTLVGADGKSFQALGRTWKVKVASVSDDGAFLPGYDFRFKAHVYSSLGDYIDIYFRLPQTGTRALAFAIATLPKRLEPEPKLNLAELLQKLDRAFAKSRREWCNQMGKIVWGKNPCAENQRAKTKAKKRGGGRK